MRATKNWAAAVAIVAASGTAHAELFDRGGGMIYDSTLDITWLKDWNYAATSGYAEANAGGTGKNLIRVNGRMGWDAATTWANNLVFGGYSDWRLPTVSPVSGGSFQYGFSNNGSTDNGYGRVGAGWGLASEMGHLYYASLGNTGRCTPNDASPSACAVQSGFGLMNTVPFENMQAYVYWSGAEYLPNLNLAWAFSPDEGDQTIGGKGSTVYAVAVRPGDVALVSLPPVPEPGSVAMLLAGLACLGVALRRRTR